MLRDFTEEFFNEYYNNLTTEALDEAYLKEVDAWQGDFWDKVGGAISNPGAAIVRGFNRLFDEDEFTKTEIRDIQTAVYTIEDTYSPKTAMRVDAFKALEKVLLAHRDCFTSGEKTEIDLGKLENDLGDAATALQEARQRMIDEVLATFYNDDGTYNWDAIYDLFHKDGITSVELMALAQFYFLIDPSDDETLETFFYMGYDREFIIDFDNPGGGIPYNLSMTANMMALAALVFDLALAEAIALLWNPGVELSDEERKAIEDRLKLAMAINYIATYASEIEYFKPDILGTPFNFDNFDEDGTFQFFNQFPGYNWYEVKIPDISDMSGIDSFMHAMEENDWAYLKMNNYRGIVEKLLGAVFGAARGALYTFIPGYKEVAFLISITTTIVKSLAEAYALGNVNERHARVDAILFAAGKLGARIIYTVTKDGVVIHHISFDTGEAMVKIAGFLQNNPGLTTEQLIDILLNGTPDTPGYGGVLDEETYGDAERQRQIIDEFNDYFDSKTEQDGYVHYRDGVMKVFRDNLPWLLSVYGDKYENLADCQSIDTMPYDVLQTCIQMYNRNGGQ